MNVYREDILTIWFDAWKYERDEYLAIIPLLKLVETEIENSQHKNTWQIVKRGIERTASAYNASTKLITGIGHYGSAETNLDIFVKSLKVGGSVQVNGKTISYYSHPTEHLKLALETLRKNKGADRFRIVVFIDDLDRCSPEKAVEVLESIKSFFDIEGIIYVIGMNVVSIDNIIKAKYGEKSSIIGVDYMDKIVQLHFNIPNWNEQDLTTLIDNQLSHLKDPTLVDALKNHMDIILNAIKNNPRAAKRFINDIILIKAAFSSIAQSYIDQLIVVQALRSNSEWDKFLDFITPNDKREKILHLLTNYFKHPEKYFEKNYDEKVERIKVKNPLLKNILVKYPLLFRESDSLHKFLKKGALEELKKIENMEPLRRASSTTFPFQQIVTNKFDYESTYQRATKNFKVYYESSLGSPGENLARAILESCEPDYNKIASYFGGITPPGLLFNIIIAQLPRRGEKTMEAYHYGCSGTDIYVDVIDKTKVDINLARFLAVSQIVEVFSAALFTNWDCEKTNGEALSRVIAADMYPNKNTHYEIATSWLDSKDRQNFIRVNKLAYENLAALGCSVLFLNYLHYQLKFTWKQIITNGAPTLEQTYTRLTQTNDGFLKFNDLLQKHFPLGRQHQPVTDNPFPLETSM